MKPASPTDFAHIDDQHVERVYRNLLARIGCVPEAEDLTADTFRAALEGFARFRPGQAESALLAWLLGIARHKLVDAVCPPGSTSYRTDPPLPESDTPSQWNLGAVFCVYNAKHQPKKGRIMMSVSFLLLAAIGAGLAITVVVGLVIIGVAFYRNQKDK